jgi:hypothetical protein
MKAFTVKTHIEAVVFVEFRQIVPLSSAAANPTRAVAMTGLDVLSFRFLRLDGFRPARSL